MNVCKPYSSGFVLPGDDYFNSCISVWDAFITLLQKLQRSSESEAQIRAALDAIREGTKADFVFWYAGSSSDRVASSGEGPLSSANCRSLVRRILDASPSVDGQLVRSDLNGIAWNRDAHPVPASVAMVRMSKSKNIWVVAVTFNPASRLDVNDIKVMRLAQRMLLNQRHNSVANAKLKDVLFGLLRCLTATIDAKDRYTCGHSERVARIAVQLGKELGVSEAAISDIYLSGLLHDIGKIGIADSVLQKSGQLTADEFAHIQLHTVIGDKIVSNVCELDHLRAGVRNHHERYDGTGYPDQLAGEDIPMLARILAVADGFDAMMSARPYRSALPSSKIDRIMQEGAGTQWDPKVIDCYVRCRFRLYPISEQGIGESVYAAVQRIVDRDEPSSLSRMQDEDASTDMLHTSNQMQSPESPNALP